MQKLRQLGISGAFVSVTTLFFAWGFISSNNDPLMMALRASFQLSYTEAMQIQLVSFLANGLVSLPAASLGNRFGAVRTILLALMVMIMGCLLVHVGLMLVSWPAVLGALFVLAAGITMLQVSANPLAAALGPQETSHFRLNFAQTFNALGVVIGVNYGAAVMLGDRVLSAERQAMQSAAERQEVLNAVSSAFLLMAVLLTLLMVFFASRRHRITDLDSMAAGSVLEAIRSGWAIFGAIAIGLYVGAEVSIGSIMIAFLNQSGTMGLPLEVAGFYLANFYWGGALAGRFLGSILLTRIKAPRLLGICAIMAISLCLIALGGSGALAGYAALSIGLFNSIMFPTIFSLTLERSDASQSSTSGLLVLAISFGAILPFLVARLADATRISLVFAVPATAYFVIALFAWHSSSLNGGAHRRRSASDI